MIWFYRFELRLLPGATALTLYAPDWEQAKASPGYRDFLQAHRPRSLQVVEFPLGYPARQDRAATPEEIRNLSVQDGNFRNPRFQRAAPTYRYEYFGNQAVLEPLAWKLRAGYARCCAAWKSWMEQGRTELYDRLEQVCAVQTVYENLMDCGHCYPTEYMAALLRLDRPLQRLSAAYTEQIGFRMEPEIADLLESQKQLPEAALPGHPDPMARLSQNLDREFQTALHRWESLDFAGVLRHAMEIFTTRQLYQGLKERIAQDSSGSMAGLSALDNPLTLRLPGILGEREIRVNRIDQLPGLLQGMFPDIVPEPDVWGIWKLDSAVPEQADAVHSLTL